MRQWAITDYAQSQLKDIVYVEMPEIGSRFKKGDSLGVVESVKTVADLYSPCHRKDYGDERGAQGSSSVRQ